MIKAKVVYNVLILNNSKRKTYIGNVLLLNNDKQAFFSNSSPGWYVYQLWAMTPILGAI